MSTAQIQLTTFALELLSIILLWATLSLGTNRKRPWKLGLLACAIGLALGSSAVFVENMYRYSTLIVVSGLFLMLGIVFYTYLTDRTIPVTGEPNVKESKSVRQTLMIAGVGVILVIMSLPLVMLFRNQEEVATQTKKTLDVNTQILERLEAHEQMFEVLNTAIYDLKEYNYYASIERSKLLKQNQEILLGQKQAKSLYREDNPNRPGPQYARPQKSSKKARSTGKTVKTPEKVEPIKEISTQKEKESWLKQQLRKFKLIRYTPLQDNYTVPYQPRERLATIETDQYPN